MRGRVLRGRWPGLLAILATLLALQHPPGGGGGDPVTGYGAPVATVPPASRLGRR